MNQESVLLHYWAQGDTVSRLVMAALLLMSLMSWYFILAKSWSTQRARGSSAAVNAFWDAPSYADGLALLRAADTEKLYAPLAQQAAKLAQMQDRDAAGYSSLTTRTLRREIDQVVTRLEAGLTVLASIGATAPFVGLLGTVWGIYHALTAVSLAGTMQLDKVAGPVGEALIMTALGLTVAIPAVLAYNAFTRTNRLCMATLDAFAHDLQAYLQAGVWQTVPAGSET